MKDTTLIGLLESSMGRKQKRVSLQRLLMMQARYGILPEELQDCLDGLITGTPSRELRRMRQAAYEWAAMLRRP